MSTELVQVDENPMKKFDAPILKAMGSTQLDAAAPRAMFLPTNMGEAMELAKLMAASNFVPPHLRGKPGDCLAVVMQAGRWAMDPFAVGNKTYFVNDRMAYESQLVNAVVNSSGALNGRLKVEWSGSGNDLKCTVSGHVKGDPELKTRTVDIKTITTRNSPLWKQDPEQQIAYFTTRAWARLHTPEVLLGVYTPDELREIEPVEGRPAKLTAGMLQAQARPSEEAAAEAVVDEEPETGRSDEQHGDQFDGTDDDPAKVRAQAICDEASMAETIIDLRKIEADAERHLIAMPDELRAWVDAAFAAAQKRLSAN